MSRRLLILQTQNEKGYFDGYKSQYGEISILLPKWFSFDKSNRFQLEKLGGTLYPSSHLKAVVSMANSTKEYHNTAPSSQPTSIGYDSSKKYNLRIKALNKIVSEESDIEDLIGDGSLTFFFKGSDITKTSQSINIRDIDQGTEFIIPIEKGEILNNFYVEYLSDISDIYMETYSCRILFEVYFEEITE
jgi:hypothetical protein